MSTAEVFERFYSFERDRGLFGRSIGGVRYWPLVRFEIYSRIVLPRFVAIGDAHPDQHMTKPVVRTLGALSTKILRRLREEMMANPLRTFGKVEVLYALTPRLARCADGRLVRQVVDLVQERVKSSAAILEYPQPDASYVQVLPGPRVLCAGAVLRKARLVRESADFAGLREAIADEAVFLAKALGEDFGVEDAEPILKRRIASAVATDLGLTPLWRRMLERLGTRCVVTVVHYNNKNQCLAKAAHELGIPVVELQHGTVYPSHAAYNLAQSATKYAPDYLLAWGDHWIGQVRNYARISALSVGYPFLETFFSAARSAHVEDGSRQRVLFVSQGTIGMPLSRAAVELRGRLPPERYDIVYKLHPNESRRWRELYPWLVGSGVEVVENKARTVYALLGETDAVVGVHSTALIEGLMWGRPTFVFKDLAGGDTMTPFFVTGAIHPVGSVNDLADALMGRESSSALVAGERFWKPNAAENISNVIDSIVEKGHP